MSQQIQQIRDHLRLERVNVSQEAWKEVFKKRHPRLAMTDRRRNYRTEAGLRCTKVSPGLLSKLLKRYGELVMEEVLKGEVVRLPWMMGYFFITKIHRGLFHTRHYNGYSVKSFDNAHTDGYLMRIRWASFKRVIPIKGGLDVKVSKVYRRALHEMLMENPETHKIYPEC